MFKLAEPGFLTSRCMENYVNNQLNSNHFKNLQITSYISEDLFQAKSTFFLYNNLKIICIHLFRDLELLIYVFPVIVYSVLKIKNSEQ